jgi:ribonuclease R
MKEIGQRISVAERRAMAAERETTDRLIAHYLADRVGATFSGRVSGVTGSGLFVKLDEIGADGYVPVGTLGADYFHHDEGQHALIGSRTGEAFRLGDRVTVELVEALPVAGALRFEILSQGRFMKTSASKRGRFRDKGRRGNAPGLRSGESKPMTRVRTGKAADYEPF